MNHLEGTKTDAALTASVTAGQTHSHEIDTYGCNYASVDVVFSKFTAATSSYATVLKVQESDTSGSGHVDVPGMTVAAGAGSTTGATGAVCRFNVDLRGRKRYLKVVATPGNSASITSVARLSKCEEMPTVAAQGDTVQQQGNSGPSPAGVNNFVSG
jgi:hypothetical protein